MGMSGSQRREESVCIIIIIRGLSTDHLYRQVVWLKHLVVSPGFELGALVQHENNLTI